MKKGMDNITEALKTDYPSRGSQIRVLSYLLSETNDKRSLPYNILLHGPPATGKITFLNQLLRLLNKEYVFVDCNECYVERLLFNIILRLLSKGNPSELMKCDSFEEFVAMLKEAGTKFRKTSFIVLKNCQNLGAPLISSLMKLPQLLYATGWKFCLIFIDHSMYVYEHHIGNDLVGVFFPRHNKEQMLNVLRILRNEEFPEQLYNNFLNIFLPNMFQIYRDVYELKRVAQVLFPIYKKPIDESRLRPDQVYALQKSFEKMLRTDCNTSVHPFLYRTITNSKDGSSETGFFNKQVTLDLPLSIKYLLIAAYLASYLPAKYDKKKFCKMSANQKRRNVSAVTQWKKNIDLHSAPKAFALNRLLAIYYAISNDTNITSSMVSQVTTLVELKLISFVGGDDKHLNLRNYKCIASFNCVDDVARSENIELTKYLME